MVAVRSGGTGARGVIVESTRRTMTLVFRDHARFVAQDGNAVTLHAVSFVRQPLCG